TEFNTQFQKEKFNLNLKFGGEYQVDDNKLDQYDNVFGKPGDFEFTNTTTSINALGFANARLTFGKNNNWVSEAGLTFNQLEYQSNGFSTDVAKIDTSTTYTAVLPRISLMRITDKIGSFYVNFAQGNSPPSIFELLDPESGDFAENLQPEDAWNLEFGTRNTIGKGNFSYDISAYNSELTNSIFPKTDSTGLTLFTNEGVIRSKGIEALLQFTLFNNAENPKSNQLIETLTYTIGGQYQDQQFKNIPFGDQVFTDVQVPGVAKWKTSQQLSLKFKFGLSIQAQHQWLDQVAFDNENTVFSPAYHLLNAKVNYRLPFSSDKVFLDLFAGGNNLTDALYMDFLQVNGVFGRLYNPAPERNFYSGIRLKAYL
ncbi:MAG: TonB-dependent receptor domain-containing protein, partial [Flavobacteriales bacterium]